MSKRIACIIGALLLLGSVFALSCRRADYPKTMGNETLIDSYLRTKPGPGGPINLNRSELEKEIIGRRVEVREIVLRKMEQYSQLPNLDSDSHRELYSLVWLTYKHLLGIEGFMPILSELIEHKDGFIRTMAFESLKSNFSLEVLDVVVMRGFESSHKTGNTGNTDKKSLELFLDKMRVDEVKQDIYRDGSALLTANEEAIDAIQARWKAWYVEHKSMLVVYTLPNSNGVTVFGLRNER